MKIGRNDPCRCRSGVKYKYCHFELDTAPPDRHLQVARKLYDRNWQKNAAHYTSQTCYEWMASQLKPFSPKRILDIGCGEGSGLIALISTSVSDKLAIISLEENNECIQTAKRHLDAKGYQVAIINRIHAQQTVHRQYRLGIERGKLVEHPGLTLIEANILLKDDDLFTFLLSIPRFDAVTLWLIGTHFAMPECENIGSFPIRTGEDYYRRIIYKVVYEHADRLLRSGGVLQIVDRGEVPNTKYLRNELLNEQKDQASGTSLDVKLLEYHVYNELGDNRRVAMKATPGKSGRTPDLSQLAMISVISVKP